MSIDRNIDREIRFHFDARIADLVAQGLSPADARARAAEEFGDVDATRHMLRSIDQRMARKRSRIEWLDGVRQDVTYAFRSLRRAPAVSLTIILTLALGLGVNAAMFSLLDAIFLRPPAGVVHPEQVRRVYADRHFSNGLQAWPGYDYSQYDVVAKALANRADVMLYSGPESRKLSRGENAPKAAVSGTFSTYFAMLGVKPALGRFFQGDEDRVDSHAPVAIISDAFWKRQLNHDPDVIGKTLRIAGYRTSDSPADAQPPLTIIGVTPPHFSGTELDATEVWVPMSTAIGTYAPGGKPWWQNPNINGFRVLFRLHPDSRESELAQQATIALRSPNIGYRQDTLTVARFGSIIAARGPGTIKNEVLVATRAAGVAIIVLLIACANVVNLLLARAVQRRREIAVRLALGVSRARLMRLLVTESTVLAIAAVVAAIVAGVWGGALLRTFLIPEVHFAESPLHWRVLAFAFAVAIVAGTIAGFIPAVQSASPDLSSALKAGSRGIVAQRSRLRGLLVVVQAALSVVLLVGAVLFVRSLQNVKSHDIGFAVGRLAFADVVYEFPDSARDAAIPSRLRALAPRVAGIPGVEGVGFTSIRPRYGMQFLDYFADADTVGRRLPAGITTAVSPNYFAITGTRLLRGQTFSANAGGAAPTVILNQAMSDALWPHDNPIGRCVHFRKPDAPCSIVIGVVQTAMLNSIDEDPSPHFYLPIDQPLLGRIWEPTIVIRAAPDRLVAIDQSVRELLRTDFPGAIPAIHTMAETMEPEYRPWKLGATLFTLFGVLALVVAAIGIYSTVSYAVNQRTHEFGVRVALGARASHVLRLVIGDGLRTVAAGIVIGVILSVAAGRLVASLLYGITPGDPATMILVALILLGIATAAALMPALRAAKADPLTALRAD